MRHIHNLNTFSSTQHPAQAHATAECVSCSALTTNKQAAPLRYREGFSEAKLEHALIYQELYSKKL